MLYSIPLYNTLALYLYTNNNNNNNVIYVGVSDMTYVITDTRVIYARKTEELNPFTPDNTPVSGR